LSITRARMCQRPRSWIPKQYLASAVFTNASNICRLRGLHRR
jgi:hypothetical protein